MGDLDPHIYAVRHVRRKITCLKGTVYKEILKEEKLVFLKKFLAGNVFYIPYKRYGSSFFLFDELYK